jgi:hypothetical protein
MKNLSTSCIISLYKCDYYLEKFLLNLSEQKDFLKHEFIFYHVCPTINEKKKIFDFIKKSKGNIIYIKNNIRVSLPTAWNECIKASTKQLIAIWNVDDLRTKNSLHLQVSKFKNNIDFVYGNFTICNKFGLKKGKFINHCKLNKIELSKSMILGPFFMFRKKIIKKIGFFDEQLKSSADFDFAIRLAHHSNGHCIKSNLGFFLNMEKGLSTNSKTLQSIENNIVYLRYGIFDKLIFSDLARIYTYKINEISFNKNFYPVSIFFKNYKTIMQKKVNEYEKKDYFIKKMKRFFYELKYRRFIN